MKFEKEGCRWLSAEDMAVTAFGIAAERPVRRHAADTQTLLVAAEGKSSQERIAELRIPIALERQETAVDRPRLDGIVTSSGMEGWERGRFRARTLKTLRLAFAICSALIG